MRKEEGPIKMYIPINFKPYELVDQKTFEKFGTESWKFFRPELLQTLDELRNLFASPITINDWRDGGNYTWSGLRTQDCYIGAKWSPHRFGMAADIKVRGMAAKDVQKSILQLAKAGNLKKLRRMELETLTWTHVDVMETGSEGIVTFANPDKTGTR